jgi:hypothetical protein
MVIGYYDAHGFPNMITGGDGSNSWTVNQQAVKDMIASPGHITDYWGVDKPQPPPRHLDNCVADFMGTSRDPYPDGATPENYIVTGLKGYARYAGYANAGGGWCYYEPGYSSGLWAKFRSEIDRGRPMVLYVDSTADGVADHFVPAFGYRYDGIPTNPINPQYRANTTGNVEDWFPFVSVSTNRVFAIKAGTWFNPNNEPPVARAGGTYAMNPVLGGSITLDGSGSFDPDGNVMSWGWDLNQDGHWDLLGKTATLTRVFLNSLGWAPGESRDILLAVTDDMNATGTATTRLIYAQPGDADYNGVVDAADYLALKSNFGTASGATWEQGDFNNDGKVGWDDLQVLMGNFGPRQPIGASAPTPEPATLGLLALGDLALIRHRRRPGRRRFPHGWDGHAMFARSDTVAATSLQECPKDDSKKGSSPNQLPQKDA